MHGIEDLSPHSPLERDPDVGPVYRERDLLLHVDVPLVVRIERDHGDAELVKPGAVLVVRHLVDQQCRVPVGVLHGPGLGILDLRQELLGLDLL